MIADTTTHPRPAARETDRHADFVARFAEYWRRPRPDGLAHVLADDVRLVQPLGPTTHGLRAARRSFAVLLAWIPDLHAEVDDWSGRGDTVFIEFRLIGTIGGKPYSWPAVDRFTLRGDLACERISYFDGLPLTLHILKHPSMWWARFRARNAGR
jgi:hypothetical protein